MLVVYISNLLGVELAPVQKVPVVGGSCCQILVLLLPLGNRIPLEYFQSTMQLCVCVFVGGVPSRYVICHPKGPEQLGGGREDARASSYLISQCFVNMNLHPPTPTTKSQNAELGLATFFVPMQLF